MELEPETLAEFGERLKAFSEHTHYYESFDEVMKDFESFGFKAKDLESLNKHLEWFKLEVYEYAKE